MPSNMLGLLELLLVLGAVLVFGIYELVSLYRSEQRDKQKAENNDKNDLRD